MCGSSGRRRNQSRRVEGARRCVTEIAEVGDRDRWKEDRVGDRGKDPLRR
jgi:hypothetical protein